MKIILKNCIIELEYFEFQKIFPLNSKVIPIKSKPIPIKRKKGSGNYKHKSKVPDEKKTIIKKIFTHYPNRSYQSVARELNLTIEQVRYWKGKLCQDHHI